MSEQSLPSLALRAGNVLTFVLCIAANATVGQKIGKVSRANPTHMTPDHWAFSIWGFIYMLMTGFTIYQAILPTERSGEVVNAIGPLFMVTNFCNAMWCLIFTRDTKFFIGMSCPFLLGLVAANVMIM